MAFEYVIYGLLAVGIVLLILVRWVGNDNGRLVVRPSRADLATLGTITSDDQPKQRSIRQYEYRIKTTIRNDGTRSYVPEYRLVPYDWSAIETYWHYSYAQLSKEPDAYTLEWAIGKIKAHNAAQIKEVKYIPYTFTDEHGMCQCGNCKCEAKS